MKQLTANTFVLELSAYTRPDIIEARGKDYVLYGKKNDHFDYLIDRYTGSPTNQAIIDGKTRLIYGKGLMAKNISSPDQMKEWAKVKTMLSDEDVERVVCDFAIWEMAAIRVVKEGSKFKFSHWPMNTLRAEKMGENDTEVQAWYYHPTWDKLNYKADDLERIPAYDPDKKQKDAIYIVQKYTPGRVYYPYVSYEASVPYALLEEEIADYQINDVQNGFSGTKVVNFNNGVPGPEKRREIERDVKQTLTGSKGQKLIVAFNNDETKKTTIDNIPLDNAPEHYSYLSEECEKKLLRGHKAPSVLLGFNADNSGLANNAEELRNKMIAFDNYVIKSFQQTLIRAFERLLNDAGMTMDLYFVTLEPLEFTGENAIEEEEETAVEASFNLSADHSLPDLVDFVNKGESIDEDLWEEIDAREVDYDLEEELDAQVLEMEREALRQDKPTNTQQLKKWVTNLVSTGTARPNTKSAQDEQVGENYYRVRYRYIESPASKAARAAHVASTGKPSQSRPFCKAMESSNKLYRKEDIVALAEKVVNPGFGPNGADTYDIWKYKGGPWCGHRWQRVTFKSKSRFQSVENSEEVSNASAEREGYRVRNEPEVSQPPRFMPKNGYK